MIGHIEGTNIGQIFENRRALHDADIHRGLQQGISSRGESIVLSGGYVDDLDEGDTIIYTGQGGRDLKTGRQISNQTLTRGNLSLAKNYVDGNPIRVIRGSELDSMYAPNKGYRYDGLYMIDNYWKERGTDGLDIIRFKLRRIEGQIALENILNKDSENKQKSEFENRKPSRIDVISSRIIRNTAVGNEVKRIYNYCCQVCGIRLVTPSGPYAECCHIKPLGRPHNGPDIIENVLCLCPNHHVMFDTHTLHISDDFTVIDTGKKIIIDSNHNINIEYLAYHRDAFSE